MGAGGARGPNRPCARPDPASAPAGGFRAHGRHSAVRRRHRRQAITPTKEVGRTTHHRTAAAETLVGVLRSCSPSRPPAPPRRTERPRPRQPGRRLQLPGSAAGVWGLPGCHRRQAGTQLPFAAAPGRTAAAGLHDAELPQTLAARPSEPAGPPVCAIGRQPTDVHALDVGLAREGWDVAVVGSPGTWHSGGTKACGRPRVRCCPLHPRDGLSSAPSAWPGHP